MSRTYIVEPLTSASFSHHLPPKQKKSSGLHATQLRYTSTTLSFHRSYRRTRPSGLKPGSLRRYWNPDASFMNANPLEPGASVWRRLIPASLRSHVTGFVSPWPLIRPLISSSVGSFQSLMDGTFGTARGPFVAAG